MTDNPIPDELRSDHLFLLMGTNPLPNLVAALLLTKANSTVWVLHSDRADGEPSTKPAAVSLESALGKRAGGLTVKLHPIPSSDNVKIENSMVGILAQLDGLKGTVGLNYTGATKPMSIHTYRMVEGTLRKCIPPPVFSYLDPRKLALRFDGRGTESTRIFGILKNDTLRERVEIDLDELALLHGYKRVYESSKWAEPEKTPGLLEVCAAITQVHANQQGLEQWRTWRKPENINVLPDATTYPRLQGVIRALDKLCGGTDAATRDKVAAILLPHKNNPSLASCQDWFNGIWFEQYGQDCLQRAAKQCPINFVSNNRKYRARVEISDEFELDAAAIYGYQLYAISFITTHRKKFAKEHLLEVFVRARQLGGDEARVGLVCCVDDPDQLRKEIARQWDAEGKIRVFGRNDLLHLTDAFVRWFQTANQ